MYNKPLTKLETFTLKLRSEGNSAKMTAKIQGVSPNTIVGREKNIRFKLGVENMYQAISEGFKRGIICISFGFMITASFDASTAIRTPRARITRARRTRSKKKVFNTLTIEDLVYVVA